jgi:multidrug resistance efflux pump
MTFRTVLFSTALLTAACNSNKDVITPEVKPLTEAVYASGLVVAEDEYQVFAQVDGYLAEKMVSDGDAVKKGDVIFVIESAQQGARLQIARENYDLAKRNNGADSPVLQELQTAIAAARTKMQYDSINFTRYENLLKQNATTKAAYDSYKLMYENARQDYAAQLSRLKKTKNQLHTEFENAAAQLRIAGEESDRYVVKSDIDGKVFNTTKEKGELIRRGEMIGVVGRDDNFYLQLSIDEQDIQRVKKDQKVLVKIDAYPDKIFQAAITKVYPMVNPQQQSLRADAALREALPGAFSGLAVEANIIIREKNDALVIPKTALLPGDSVLIKTGKGKQKVKVKTGIQTLDEIEIVEGLTTQQQLLVAQ